MAASRPRLKISFTERDFGMKHFMREAGKLRKKPFVKVGATQSKGSKLHVIEGSGGEVTQKVTNADLLAIHEFGAPSRKIPARRPLGNALDKHEIKYQMRIESLKDQIFDATKHMTVEKALALVGQEVTADIKRGIRDGLAPGLSDATIRSKNKDVIAKAHQTVRSIEAKKDKLTKGDKSKLDKASDTIENGGASTPLIDTAQMINSIGYEVIMGGVQGEKVSSG